MCEMERMWINAPSNLQRPHTLHGLNVYAEKNPTYHSNATRIYFLSGSVISQFIDRRYLSPGWR